MKNTQSKIKPIKTWKELETTYCLGCKDFMHNSRLQEVKMTNKVLREKSNCVVCRNSFCKLQNKHVYCKKCKKHTGNTFLKKLIFISKNKIKGKSKRVICLIKRSFIHEIEDKYVLKG